MHISALRRGFLLPLAINLIMNVACGGDLPADSRCRGLEYKEHGLSREEYLPCAGEIVAALGELEAHSRAASQGDSTARSAGRQTLARVNALMNAAGGRNLLERWEDRALTDLNLSISNAVTHFEAFYMVRVAAEPNQFAEQTRQAAAAELQAAQRRQEEARSRYARLQ